MPEEVIVRRIDIQTKGANENLASLEGAQDKVKGSTAQLDKQMGSLPGPLGKVKQGIGGVSKAFKALLANPIVLIIAAIVAAFVALGKAFLKTQAGADKMADAMEAIQAILDVVVERAAKLFKALGKIFTGKFKEGFDDMKESVAGVGAEMRSAAQDAIALEQANRALFESETEVITANAERRQQIAELVFLTRDMTKSVEERRDAIIQADGIEKEILSENIRLQEQRVANMAQEIANTPELQRTREQSRKLAEEEAKLIQLQTDSLNKQRELKNRLITLDNEQAAARKALAAEQLTAEKEEAERLAEKEKIASDARKEQAELDREFEDAMAAEEAAREKAASEERIRIKEEETQALIQQSEARFEAEEQLIMLQIQAEMAAKAAKEGIYQDSLTALLGFLGEGSKIAKGIQIADATKSAIQGAINAYTSTLQIPFGIGAILAPIAAAAALAAGMANVRKIASTPDPLGGGGSTVPSVSLAGASAGIDSGSLVQAEQGVPQDVSIIQDSTTRRAGKAYVVSSDVTAEQEIDRQRQKDAAL